MDTLKPKGGTTMNENPKMDHKKRKPKDNMTIAHKKGQSEIKLKFKDEIIIDKNQTWHNSNEIPKMVEH